MIMLNLSWIGSSLNCFWLNFSKFCWWEQSLIIIGMQNSEYVIKISVWWLLKSEMKISMILILLLSESDWLSCCLSKVQMMILKLKSEIKIFLLEEDIIMSQQTVRKQEQVQIKVRNNSLLLTKESNYRFHIECLCLQRCLPSHLI